MQEINTAKGGRTSLFVPELSKILVAAPQNGNQEAAIYVYKITL